MKLEVRTDEVRSPSRASIDMKQKENLLWLVLPLELQDHDLSSILAAERLLFPVLSVLLRFSQES